MNAAELNTLVTIVGCPAVAGMVAASEKAGWFTVLFVVAGLAIGVGAGFCVHKIAYRFLRIHDKRTWVQCASLFAYLLVPMAILMCAIVGTGALTVWVVRHCL